MAVGSRARVLLIVIVVLAGGCASLQRAFESTAARQAHEARMAQTVAKMDAVVKRYLGARYRLGGMDRKGIDCSGFTYRVYEAVGIKLPRRAEDQYGVGRSVKSLQYGDLLFYNTKRFSPRGTCLFSFFCPTADVPWLYGLTHVTMYTGDGRMVHASPSKGVSFADVEGDYWEPRYIGAKRVLEDME